MFEFLSISLFARNTQEFYWPERVNIHIFMHVFDSKFARYFQEVHLYPHLKSGGGGQLAHHTFCSRQICHLVFLTPLFQNPGNATAL